MSNQQGSDPEMQRAVMLIAALVIGPIVVIAVIAWIAQTLGPWLWILAIVGVGLAALYISYRFKNSRPVVRSDHETELIERLRVAEAQQQALPQSLTATEIERSLSGRGMVLDPQAIEEITEVANRLYASEFLAPLPSMPGVPTDAERVYDINYDRRTLRKGEEPPYRILTDGKGRPTSYELMDYEAWLKTFSASTVNPDATRSLFLSTVADIVAKAMAELPLATRNRTSFTVPLIDMLADGKKAVADAIDVAFDRRVKQWHHFSSVRASYERNRQRASETLLRVRDLDAGHLIDIRGFDGSGREALDTYLDGSPLHELFLVGVPFAVPAEKRFEGQLVIARQGSGKTNALECLIYNDLAEVAAGRASVVVMDSQGMSRDALLGRLAKLQYFEPGGPLEGRLIYLEPDIDWPLALNVFDTGVRDLGTLTTRQREEIVGSACEVIEFLFTGLLGGELSDNMTMLYRYLVPAMLAIPQADMNTFIELLDVATERNAKPAWIAKYQRYLGALDPDVRSFLETDFLRDPELIKTKGAVRRRLRATLADTNFRRMFTQPRNKLDLFTELQAGRVVLVNTFAAGNYVEQFGRLILALLMQATHRRLTLDREHRTPTYVYLDECQDYISREERIARYIDKCRKQNVALIFATQRLGTIESARVLNALKGAPIKLAGGSDADADELAALLNSTGEHIKSLPRGRFTAYVSGVTTRPVDITFPLSPIESLPRLSEREFDVVRREMRDRYAVRYDDPSEQPSAPYADFREEGADSGRPGLPAPDPEKRDDTSRRPPDDDYDPLS